MHRWDCDGLRGGSPTAADRRRDKRRVQRTVVDNDGATVDDVLSTVARVWRSPRAVPFDAPRAGRVHLAAASDGCQSAPASLAPDEIRPGEPRPGERAQRSVRSLCTLQQWRPGRPPARRDAIWSVLVRRSALRSAERRLPPTTSSSKRFAAAECQQPAELKQKLKLKLKLSKHIHRST